MLWLNQNGEGVGKPSFWVGDGPWLNADIVVNDGQWHHIAGTYDGATSKIYVDGVLLNNASLTENLSSSNVLQIGGSSYCGNYFNGNIDEVKIWNYALDNQEIIQSMNSSQTGVETNLVGYWPFEGNFLDFSTYGHSSSAAGNTVIISDAPELINDQYRSIIAWEKDDVNGLPGFTPGNSMAFKLWTEINSIPTELAAAPTYILGTGNFGYGQYSAASLSFELPEISVSPGSFFIALEEPDSTVQTFTIKNTGTEDLSINASFNAIWGTNDSADLVLKINSLGLVEGLYESVLTIESNDPDHPDIDILVSLNVTGNAQIAASDSLLNFGQVVLNDTNSITLLISNIMQEIMTRWQFY